MPGNSNLRKAKKVKNDEFYTYLFNIEKEMKHYKSQFKSKVIMMPCDEPELKCKEIPDKRASQFWLYFHRLFGHLKLKKIIATHYNENGKAYMVEYSGGNDNDISFFKKTYLKGNGDFRSDEIKDIIASSDIVITNPPFSLFIPFMEQIIVEQQKKLLVIGNQNAYACKAIFKLIYENKLWTGYNKVDWFLTLDPKNKKEIKKSVKGGWFTNLEVEKRLEKIELWKSYNAKEYPAFDHSDAILSEYPAYKGKPVINVNKVSEIPYDYDGLMGVPITFINKYNPDQFKIVDSFNRYFVLKGITKLIKGKILTNVNNKSLYSRILIKRRQ